jgi:fructokinase
MIGRDMFGDFLVDSLQHAGVDTGFVVRTDQAKTALAFVALDAEGERSFSSIGRRPQTCCSAPSISRRSASMDRHVPRLLQQPDRIGHRRSHAGRDAPARAAGALVSFDLNLRRICGRPMRIHCHGCGRPCMPPTWSSWRAMNWNTWRPGSVRRGG